VLIAELSLLRVGLAGYPGGVHTGQGQYLGGYLCAAIQSLGRRFRQVIYVDG
jgi:hypothetical protein